MLGLDAFPPYFGNEMLLHTYTPYVKGVFGLGGTQLY